MYVFRLNDRYWNGEAWGDFKDAKYYVGDEVETLALPVAAEMVALWEIDEAQFPRLIAELNAAGAITEDVKQQCCTSMDLTPAEFDELLDRADRAWERSKAKLPRG